MPRLFTESIDSGRPFFYKANHNRLGRRDLGQRFELTSCSRFPKTEMKALRPFFTEAEQYNRIVK